MARVAVLNAGGWGTALSVLLANAGHETVLWARRDELASELVHARENKSYLPGVQLPGTVRVTTDLAEAAHQANLVLAVPVSTHLRPLAQALDGVLRAGIPVVHGTKGLEADSLLRPSEVFRSELGAATPIGVLSGPTHAEEVGRGIPTAAVIACSDGSVGRSMQETLNSEAFRVYTNQDVIGVELCAAVKNVFAIAAGISDGLGYGDNAKAALMTRSLAELNRLVVAAGGRSGTVAGLAGMGDLVATCTSRHSRNRRAGEQIGRGATLDQVLASTHQAIEGIAATPAALSLAERLSVEMPIASQVYAVLFAGKSPSVALHELMSREATHE